MGSAPCAYADVENAKKLFPNAEMMLVNGACTMFEDAEHMLAGHTAKAEEFARAREKAFPFAPPIRIHANSFRTDHRQPKREYPSVTDWHGPEMSSGATSAGKAVAVGISLGYRPIILCGCPMDGSGYAADEAQVSQDKSCQRVGDPKLQDRRTIKNYRERLIALSQTVFKGKVFSMSGFTRQHLGAPNGF